MNYVIFLLPLVVSAGFLSPLPDLGVSDWECDPTVMVRSKKVPTSVHSVRFADIDVIAALGDSMTAGNGASARQPLALFKEFRGQAFAIGGEHELEEHITIPNVLKKFNPKLFGYSTGSGRWNNWNMARLNMAIAGSQVHSLPEQAQHLVDTIRQHPEVDMENHWKLVNIFIGGNDACDFCFDKDKNITTSPHGPVAFKTHLVRTIQILKDNLPRTIVSLTGMLNIEILRPVDELNIFCKGLHYARECHCAFNPPETEQMCRKYMAVEQSIQDEGIFESSDDFTFVIQPFTNGIDHPPMTADGKADLKFFAPDCFHFSKFGHSNVARHLWNTIIQPVGAKQTSVNLSDFYAPLNCPDKACPLFPTVKNSRNCTTFLTPSALE